MQDEKTRSSLQHAAGSELLPLSVAAHVAYAEFTKSARQMPSGEPLTEVLWLTAIALSQIAPLYRAGNRSAMSRAEIRDLFFKPHSSRGEPPDLDAFQIRRADFHEALETLRHAKSISSRRP